MSEILRTPEGHACRAWRRDGSAECALLVHGIESHALWFDAVGQRLADAGVDAYGLDRRGSGLNRGPGPFTGRWETLADDQVRLALELRRHYARTHLVGLSWGGKLAAALAARDGDLFDSLALVTPSFGARTGYGAVERAAIRLTAALAPDRPVRLPLAPEMYSRSAATQGRVRDDAMRLVEAPARFLDESIRLDRALRRLVGRVTLPVTLVLAGRDAIIDNDSARAAVAEMPARVREVRQLEDAGHALVLDRPGEIAEELLASFGRAPAGGPLRVLVFGAGAVGTYLGGKLAARGAHVTLVGRQDFVRAVRGRGLVVEEPGAETAVREIVAAESIPAGASFDLALLATKLFDAAAALDAFERAGLGGGRTVLASFQSGASAEEELAHRFPRAPILAGALLARLSAAEPGRVVRHGVRGGIALGRGPKLDEERFERLARSLAGVGLPFAAAEARSVKWSKMLPDAAFGALSAIADRPAAAVLADPELFALAARAFGEAAAVMDALHVRAVDLPGWRARTVRRAMRLPLPLARRVVLRVIGRSAAAGRSSLWGDLARGAGRTEVREINGAVARLGRMHGVDAPVNAALAGAVERLAAEGPAARLDVEEEIRRLARAERAERRKTP